MGQFFEAVEPATKMKKIPKFESSSLKEPHFASIEQRLGNQAPLAKSVEEWLRNTEDTALTLYWSRARPRK
jgi:hypothetical protein